MACIAELRDRRLAGGASQHTAPPVRRAPRWGPSRSVGRLAETAEEAAHRRRLGDERDEAHASAAAWTCEDVDICSKTGLLFAALIVSS